MELAILILCVANLVGLLVAVAIRLLQGHQLGMDYLERFDRIETKLYTMRSAQEAIEGKLDELLGDDYFIARRKDGEDAKP